MKRKAALVLAMLMVLCSVAAVSAEDGTVSRIVVYQETFEEGLGEFLVPAGASEAQLNWESDSAGNHYVVLRLDPEKLESIATYTKTPGGRWGTEFYTWPIQVETPFVFLNDKNYQFMFEGSYQNDETFSSPKWGTGVLHMTNKSIWANPTGPEAADNPRNEVFASPTTGSEVADKSGWYDCYSAASWLTSYKFGTTRTGDADSGYQFSGDAVLSYFHVRTNLATSIAQIMADNKFYCGKGTGLTNADGVPQSGEPWGAYYKFTLEPTDFYGDEQLFNGVTDQDKKTRLMNEKIYQNGTDGEKIVYSLGGDCSFLYSPTRIAKFKEYMANYNVGYAMDNFEIVADAYEYTDTVSVTGNGSVTALTNPATNETTVVNSGEPKQVTKNDYFGVAYTIEAAQGYELDTVTYAGSDVTPMVSEEGVLTIDASSVVEGSSLEVTFAEVPTSPPQISKIAAVDTDGFYETADGNQPAAVVYMQVTAPTDGSVIQNAGVLLSDKEGNAASNSLKLVAKNTDDTDMNQAGSFGILVYGDAFQGGTYYFTPFVTYEDSEEASHTSYAEETSFTLGASE